MHSHSISSINLRNSHRCGGVSVHDLLHTVSACVSSRGTQTLRCKKPSPLALACAVHRPTRFANDHAHTKSARNRKSFTFFCSSAMRLLHDRKRAAHACNHESKTRTPHYIVISPALTRLALRDTATGTRSMTSRSTHRCVRAPPLHNESKIRAIRLHCACIHACMHKESLSPALGLRAAHDSALSEAAYDVDRSRR